MIVNARFLTQKLTGVQRYAVEISKYLQKSYPNVVFVAPYNLLHVEIAKELDVKIIGSKTGYIWEQIELLLYLKSVGSPLLFCPANMAPIFYKQKIVTLHDIAFKKFPQGFSWKFRLIYRIFIPLILKNSKLIITASQFSKSEIMSDYGVPSEQIVVIYHGINPIFSPDSSCTKRDFILGVSSLEPRKNFKGLIEAFKQMQDSSIKLFIIGEKNSLFKKLDLEEHQNIQFLGRVSDEELVSYYNSALAFVYPTFYEGFGLPPLEAMSCGTAVIIAQTECLLEICSNAALACDPYNIDDIKDKIQLLNFRT